MVRRRTIPKSCESRSGAGALSMASFPAWPPRPMATSLRTADLPVRPGARSAPYLRRHLRRCTALDQSELLRPAQQVPDRRRMPARAPARRAFAHGFELGRDLPQRAVGRRCLDAGHQPDQPVVAALPAGAASRPASTMPSRASRCTVRRSFSTVQAQASGFAGTQAFGFAGLACCPWFSTRTTSPQG